MRCDIGECSPLPSPASRPPCHLHPALLFFKLLFYPPPLGTLPGALDINLPSRYRFMYTTLEERARAQEKMLLRLQDDLVARGLEAEAEVTPVGVPKQETVTVIGRVCCEAPEGRINKASVLLEGTAPPLSQASALFPASCPLHAPLRFHKILADRLREGLWGPATSV